MSRLLVETTLKILKIRSPKIVTVIILKIEQFGFLEMCLKDADWMANSVDPDLGLHYSLSYICPNI